MPQRKRILIGAVAALAFALAIVLVFVLPDRDRNEVAPRVTSTGSGGAVTTSTSSSPSSSSRSGPSSPSSGSNAIAAPIPPIEAMPDLVEAIAAGRTQDVVELCASATARAGQAADCTIAACREHLEAKARSWFAAVADADQPRVTDACAQVKVTVSRPERPDRPERLRPHPHPHHRSDD